MAYALIDMRNYSIILVIFASLCTGSCSRSYEVRAVFIDRTFAFVSDDNEVTHPPWCLKRFKVARPDGAVMWEFDAHAAFAQASECGPNFPLFYGKAPDGARIVVEPQRLEPNQLYLIEGDGSGMLHGAFRYQELEVRRIENLDEEAQEVRAARNRYHSARTRPSDVRNQDPAI